MSLSSYYQSGRVGLSFELFPPRTDQGEAALYRHVEILATYQPDYITCTYGAGGSTRDKTLKIVQEVKRRFQVPVASHLTLVNSTQDELRNYLQQAHDSGVDYLVALRGDPPAGDTHFEPVPGGLQYANELVSLIREEFSQFGIAVAGYPETHVEAVSPQQDLENLKRKVDAGANIVITQLFYDNEDFFRFCDRCRELSIEVPIVPGILPVTNLQQVKRITSLCGSKLPESLMARLTEREEDTDWHYQVGLEHAIEQTRQLLERGIDGLHFYVLNKSNATVQILDAVDWKSRMTV